MPIRPVIRMGDPRLLKIAQPVLEFNNPVLYNVISDMQDTMIALNGAGLAAPQIGIDLQIVIFGFLSNSRYPNAGAVPYTVLINPILTPIEDVMDSEWEGCLSVPGMRGLVPRYSYLRYQGYDINGHEIDRTVSGFHARVVQHECDHLQGILYPMRIQNMRDFGYTEELSNALPGSVDQDDD